MNGNFWRPELLASPNIPKPLHGVNPRTICGSYWWDNRRQEAYAKHDYRCFACGVPKSQAKYHQWLEAHEDYDIDWITGKVELREIVALCHSCHAFIHSGRLLAIYKSGEIDYEKAINIIESGLEICKRNNIQPYYGAYLTKYILHGHSEESALTLAKKKGWYSKIVAPWEKWHLVIEGHEYYSKFKNIQEWEEHWKNT